MRVQVLGSLTVSGSDGTAIEVAGDRQRCLLGLLARRFGQTVPVDVLTDAIWRDVQLRDRHGTLHSLVARVRRIFEAAGERDVIRTDPAGYRLDADRTCLDVDRFERLLRDADDVSPAARAPGRGDVALAGPRL